MSTIASEAAPDAHTRVRTGEPSLRESLDPKDQMRLQLDGIVRVHAGWRRFIRDDRGRSTADLLGNVALAIAALIVVWAALETLGVDIVSWIREEILGQSAST